MIDIQKQISYWQTGAIEDWAVATDLISRKRIRHGLFFVHLALEKLLKAHVCQHTQELAPRIHNLSRLVELTALTLSLDQQNILAEANAFNLEGRYPDLLVPPPTPDEAREYMYRAAEVYKWLLSLL